LALHHAGRAPPSGALQLLGRSRGKLSHRAGVLVRARDPAERRSLSRHLPHARQLFRESLEAMFLESQPRVHTSEPTLAPPSPLSRPGPSLCPSRWATTGRGSPLTRLKSAAFRLMPAKGDDVWHVNRSMSVEERHCRSADLGLADDGNGRAWPDGEVLLAAVSRPGARYYVLAIPQAALRGETLTSFLGQVAPFGCPVPGSLIRAYSLPDAPFPSVLLKEHEDAPHGLGDAYRRFLAVARRHWIAALDETGPGLSPALMWEVNSTRRLLGPREMAVSAAEAASATG